MSRVELDLDDLEAGAALCAEATIPGEQLRELIRLAKVGHALEQQSGPTPIRLVP